MEAWIYCTPGPLKGWGWEGALAINYRKLTRSAGKPLAMTHQIHSKTNASLSHSNMTCLRTLYKRVLSSMPFKTWPTLFPLPSLPVAVSITFCGCEHLLCEIFSNYCQMAVQRHDKSWHFPFLIRRFLCKQPSLFFRAHTSNGQFLFFFLLSNSMAANKRGEMAGRYVNHLPLKDARQKRP